MSFQNVPSAGDDLVLPLRTQGSVRAKAYPCPIADCGKVLSTARTLKQHLNTHAEDEGGTKKFKCRIAGCDKVYASESALGVHRTRKHHDFTGGEPRSDSELPEGAEGPTLPPTPSKKSVLPKEGFPCPHEGCTTICASKHELDLHTPKHEDYQPCYYCGRKKSVRSLPRHWKNKNACVPPIFCDGCSKYFRDDSDFSKHTNRGCGSGNADKLSCPGAPIQIERRRTEFERRQREIAEAAEQEADQAGGSGGAGGSGNDNEGGKSSNGKGVKRSKKGSKKKSKKPRKDDEADDDA